MRISDINKHWREGRYLDLWSLNHVLSGVVLGSILFSLGAPFGWSLLAAIVLFVGWEVAEILLGIKEHTPNMVMDVICDLLGFLTVAYWLFVRGETLSLMATLAFILLFAVMNIWGFMAYEERRIDSIPEKLQTHL